MKPKHRKLRRPTPRTVAEFEADLEAVRVSGQSPLEYFLALMRNTKLLAQRRDWAAMTAAPYIHGKRMPVASDGSDIPAVREITIRFVSAPPAIPAAFEAVENPPLLPPAVPVKHYAD